MSVRHFLLCTDLDRTLVPNGLPPESPEARPLFAQLVKQRGVHLAYVSGRSLPLVEAAIRDYALPLPDFAITDVGTRIYARGDGGWEACADWDAAIAADWGDYDHAALARLFSGIEMLTLQEPAKQNVHKLSYYFSLDVDPGEIEAALLRHLQGHHVLASIVLSVDDVADVGLCDVIPARATKLHAIQFLRDRLGLGLDEMLFAGDSGNDLAVFASGVPSVLVANATDEVRHAALERARESGHEQSVYCARGDFMGLNGNYSAGILEGVEHYYPERMTVVVRTFRR